MTYRTSARNNSRPWCYLNFYLFQWRSSSGSGTSQGKMYIIYLCTKICNFNVLLKKPIEATYGI